MVFVKHNSLKSDIFCDPIFIAGFSGSKLFRVQVFQGLDPGSGSSVQGPRPGSGSRVQGPGSRSRIRVQGLEIANINISIKRTSKICLMVLNEF